MKYLIAITLAFLLDLSFAQAQSVPISVPGVFLIGEHEDQYLILSKQHPATFISVYNNDIDRAFRGWSEMLMDMEDFAVSKEFDLKGVKLWFNIYFKEDGSVDHLAFYPKPNSRYIPIEDLTAFFESFISGYRLPVNSVKAFQHSASGGFPTFFSRDLQPTVRRN